VRILVTGGCGFIGSNFIRYILQHYKPALVTNVDVLTYAGNLSNLDGVVEEHGERYEFFKADIANADAMDALMTEHQFFAVINFAAESHVDRSINSPLNFIHTNVVGTSVLLDCARRHGVQQWLPKMGTGTFDQGDGSAPAPADALAELRDELEARRAAANHHDAVQDLLIEILIRARCDNLRIWIIPVQADDIALTVQNLVHLASPAYTGRYTRVRINAATSCGRGTRARPWSKM